MKHLFLISALIFGTTTSAFGAPKTIKNAEVICGNIKDKAFPYAVAVKKVGSKHIMTLAHGSTAVLRTSAKKSQTHSKSQTLFSAGQNFNLSVLSSKQRISKAYLVAKFKNKKQNTMIAGTLTCKNLM